MFFRNVWIRAVNNRKIITVKIDCSNRHKELLLSYNRILTVVQRVQLVHGEQAVQIRRRAHILPDVPDHITPQRDLTVQLFHFLRGQAVEGTFILLIVIFRVLFRSFAYAADHTGNCGTFFYFPQHSALKYPFIAKIKEIFELPVLGQGDLFQGIFLCQAVAGLLLV